MGRFRFGNSVPEWGCGSRLVLAFESVGYTVVPSMAPNVIGGVSPDRPKRGKAGYIWRYTDAGTNEFYRHRD